MKQFETTEFEPVRTFFGDSVRLDLIRDNFRNVLFLRLTEFVDNAYYSGRAMESNFKMTVEFNEDTHIMDAAFDKVVLKIKSINEKIDFEQTTKLLTA